MWVLGNFSLWSVNGKAARASGFFFKPALAGASPATDANSFAILDLRFYERTRRVDGNGKSSSQNRKSFAHVLSSQQERFRKPLFRPAQVRTGGSNLKWCS